MHNYVLPTETPIQQTRVNSIQALDQNPIQQHQQTYIYIYIYRLSSLNDHSFITRLARNQDARPQAFPAAVDDGLGLDGATDDNDFAAIVGIAAVGVGSIHEWSKVGDGERRGVSEFGEGGGVGGEFDDGSDGGVGEGETQNGAIEG